MVQRCVRFVVSLLFPGPGCKRPKHFEGVGAGLLIVPAGDPREPLLVEGANGQDSFFIICTVNMLASPCTITKADCIQQ